jgi:large subunit ribosomal protein L6
MSRIGAKPIEIPDGVSVTVDKVSILVSGKYGVISKSFSENICLSVNEKNIVIKPINVNVSTKAMWGTTRSIIFNMVKGVFEGFSIDLDIIGVGYKSSTKDGYINLSLGKSHNTKILIPENIKVTHHGSKMTIFSHDKELLGQFVAQIIKQRPPEPYKGKGIRKSGQYIERKESKKK